MSSKTWGAKTKDVKVYYNDNFVPGVIDFMEKNIQYGGDQVLQDVKVTIHEVSGRLRESARIFKLKRTKRAISIAVRMGGKMVDGEMVDYGGAEELRHGPMRSAAKWIGPILRARLRMLTDAELS